MLRKMLAAFLCLTLALFIPLQCLADLQHTFTTAISDKRISDPAVDDFLKITALHVVTGEKALAFSFAVGNAQATLALRADENGVFVHSNCLSEKVLYFTWEEAFDFLQSTLAYDVNFDAIKAQCVNAASAKSEQPAQVQGELLAAARELFANDPAMVAWLVNLASRIQLTKGVFTSATHDTATQKIELLLTTADVSKLCATRFVKAQHAAMVATEHPEMSLSEQAALVSTQAEQLQTALQGIDISLPITLFTAEHGSTLVSLALPLSLREIASGTEAEATKEPITLSTHYNRLTTHEGIEHSGSQVLTQGASQPAVAAFDYLQAKDHTAHGTWSMLAQNNELHCVYDEAHGSGVTQRTFSIYERANAVSLLPLDQNAQPLLTFCVKSQANQLPLLDEIQAATAETSLHILRMSAEEQAAFKQTMVACLTKTMAGITSQLPISVFNAMVSTN
ncbi:MAG: hypothetical protein RR821_06640 [Clostridia bacterium]